MKNGNHQRVFHNSCNRRKKEVTIKINFSNRWLYTFIILGILIAVAVGVYAYQTSGTADPAVMGHTLNELQPCSNGQTLVTAGGVWTCDSGGLKTKVAKVNINDWNMDTTASIKVSFNLLVHGISNPDQVLSIMVLIRDDTAGANNYPTKHISAGGNIGTVTKRIVEPNQFLDITIERINGGIFDNTNFDQTSYNRGWVYIVYEE